MKFKQTLSVLFYLNRKKEAGLGEIPIYIRVTIDGDSCDISLSEKIPPGARWNNEEKKLKLYYRGGKLSGIQKANHRGHHLAIGRNAKDT